MSPASCEATWARQGRGTGNLQNERGPPDGWAVPGTMGPPVQPTSSTPHLLLVEDDEVDAALTVDRLRVHAPELRVTVMRDVPAALEAARHEAPSLVLLDLGLPGPHGLTFLTAFKDDPLTRGVPVVVLSASGGDPEVYSAYRERANAFLVKPGDADGLDRVLRAFVEFWFGAVLRASDVQSS